MKISPLLLIISVLFIVPACKSSKEHQAKPIFVVIYTDDQQFKGLGLKNDAIRTHPT